LSDAGATPSRCQSSGLTHAIARPPSGWYRPSSQVVPRDQATGLCRRCTDGHSTLLDLDRHGSADHVSGDHARRERRPDDLFLQQSQGVQ